jgi:hypothetical protein
VELNFCVLYVRATTSPVTCIGPSSILLNIFFSYKHYLSSSRGIKTKFYMSIRPNVGRIETDFHLFICKKSLSLKGLFKQ